MSDITPQDFLSLSKMPPEDRLDYTISAMLKQQSIWGLFGDQGWLLLQAQDDACIPVWPHESFARAWEKEDFPDCKPKEISLSDWQEKWLPGMQSNNTLILVFPLSEDEEGIMLTAEEMRACIEDELLKD